ncbi:hypothetical protein PQU99_08165 [Vogesella sp. LYT10W]|nr:hypothetical protein [Vogesella indigofera]MDC7710836.1 hypothetical protein [Vogesella indigofera]
MLAATHGSPTFTGSDPDAVSPHQARDAMPPTSETLCKQFGMNAPVAIDAIDLGMNQPDFTQ